MAKPTKPNGSREAATALAALLLLGAAPSYAINKCTDPEGHVTFTDANCPAATRHAEKISEKGFAQTSQPTNPDASQAQDAAAQGPAAHLVDANHASEAELAGIVSPAVAAQIVSERGKGAFTGWPDLVHRVVGLSAAKSAYFASLNGLGVDGKSMQGAPPDSQKASALAARLHQNPNLKLQWSGAPTH